MKVSWEYYSQHMESHKSHVPNHQPVISWSFRYFKWLDFDRCSRYPPWRQTVAAPKACYFPCVFRVCSWYLIIFVMNFPTYLLKCFLALSLSLFGCFANLRCWDCTQIQLPLQEPTPAVPRREDCGLSPNFMIKLEWSKSVLKSIVSVLTASYNVICSVTFIFSFMSGWSFQPLKEIPGNHHPSISQPTMRQNAAAIHHSALSAVLSGPTGTPLNAAHHRAGTIPQRHHPNATSAAKRWSLWSESMSGVESTAIGKSGSILQAWNILN